MINKPIKDLKPYLPSVNVSEGSLIIDIVKILVEHPTMHHICVVDKDEKLIGLINRKRILQNVFSHSVAADTMVSKLYTLLTAEKSGELMISPIITIEEEDNINSLIEKMLENNLFEIPVVDQETHILGFVTSIHILKKWIKEQKS